MFHPENDVIRQDLFVMLYNILGKKETPHGDSGRHSGFSDRNLISPGAEELATSVKAGGSGSDGNSIHRNTYPR